jgi:hypothetical protein
MFSVFFGATKVFVQLSALLLVLLNMLVAKHAFG